MIADIKKSLDGFNSYQNRAEVRNSELKTKFLEKHYHTEKYNHRNTMRKGILRNPKQNIRGVWYIVKWPKKRN